MVFVAFLLDQGARDFLLDGRFAELRARDASLYNALSRLAPEERETLMAYLQAQVPLNEFEQAA